MSKELLEENRTLRFDENAKEGVSIISHCATHLLALVSDILDFERIESGLMDMENIPFSVVKEIDKASLILNLCKS